MKPETLIEKIIDQVIKLVVEEHPKDGVARLKVYELVADSLHGMVQAFNGTKEVLISTGPTD